MSNCSYEDFKNANCELAGIWHNKIKLDIRTILNGGKMNGKLAQDWVSYTHILADATNKVTPDITSIPPIFTDKLKGLQSNTKKRFFNYYIPISLLEAKLEQLASAKDMKDNQYMGLSGEIIDCNQPSHEKNPADNQVMVPVNCSRSGWNDFLLSKTGACPVVCRNSELIQGFDYPKYREKIQRFKVTDQKALDACSSAADEAVSENIAADQLQGQGDEEPVPAPALAPPLPDSSSDSGSDDSDESYGSSELLSDDEVGVQSSVEVRPYDISDEDNIILRIRMKASDGGRKHNEREEFINDIRENLAKPYPYLFMIHSRRWISYNFSIFDAEGSITYDYINLPVDVVGSGGSGAMTDDSTETVDNILNLLGDWFEDREAGSNPELFDYCTKLGLLSDGS